MGKCVILLSQCRGFWTGVSFFWACFSGFGVSSFFTRGLRQGGWVSLLRDFGLILFWRPECLFWPFFLLTLVSQKTHSLVGEFLKTQLAYWNSSCFCILILFSSYSCLVSALWNPHFLRVFLWVFWARALFRPLTIWTFYKENLCTRLPGVALFFGVFSSFWAVCESVCVIRIKAHQHLQIPVLRQQKLALAELSLNFHSIWCIGRIRRPFL